MEKTYKIVDATIVHPIAGKIVKENIVYFINGEEQGREFYSKNGVVDHEIRQGYIFKQD